MKQQQYARYEKGITAPGIDVLYQICRVHACSADWLLGLKDHGVSVKAGDGNAIAIGAHAKATVRTVAEPGKMPACKTCSCKRLYDAVQKAQVK